VTPPLRDAPRREPGRRLHAALLAVVLIVLLWSAIRPRDRFTWLLEVFPVIVAVPLLLATYHRFRLTDLAYVLVAAHAVILMVGGHYTYAEVPLFNWLRDALDLSRNHYDRVGHFAQGFVPAIVAREVLLRTSPLTRGKWLFVLVVSVCLAISAAYELIEWSAAALTGTAADAFLGTQGDAWDTQKDMALALFGSAFAQAVLSRVHDRQLARLRLDAETA
jgi:putative membrane protein